MSSGTSSKQIANERDAQYVGYGAMLLEGALAVIVILACCAGVGMGRFARQDDGHYAIVMNEAGQPLVGHAAWHSRYRYEEGWGAFGLGDKVGAFVDGGANFLSALGIPLQLSIGIIAVLVACFAATTLDTATRLQRYVIQELAVSFHIRPLTNKYLATAFAVVLAVSLAMMRGPTAANGTIATARYRWALPVASVWCNQPTASRPCVYGRRLLPQKKKQTNLVCHYTYGPTDYLARLGPNVAIVQL